MRRRRDEEEQQRMPEWAMMGNPYQTGLDMENRRQAMLSSPARKQWEQKMFLDKGYQKISNPGDRGAGGTRPFTPDEFRDEQNYGGEFTYDPLSGTFWGKPRPKKQGVYSSY